MAGRPDRDLKRSRREPRTYRQAASRPERRRSRQMRQWRGALTVCAAIAGVLVLVGQFTGRQAATGHQAIAASAPNQWGEGIKQITQPAMLSTLGLDAKAFVTTVVCLGTAFILGSLIGLERQIRQRNAGLRTVVLVSVGAAAFAHLGGRLLGAEGQTRIIAYVVSGIGFLGAGVIMKEGEQVRGLNTAATLWGSAAVGAFAGGGLLAESAAVAAFVLAGNTLLRPLVNYVNRRPIDPEETEALYRVHVVCAPTNVSEARDLLYEELEFHHYPVREIETLSEGDELVELAALLVPTTANPKDLDGIAEHLGRHHGVDSATWTVSTSS